MAYEPRTRLYVAADLAVGASVELAPEQAHYLKSVLRMAPGAKLALFNGRDGEWSATIEAFEKGRCTVGIGERLRVQREEGDLWLLFAPVKRARIDFLVEKATELGASLLQPVITEHTQVERVKLERLRANVMEAAEQTERLTLPEVWAPISLERALASWPEGRRLLFCDETGEAPDIAAALAAQPRGAWALLIGPEGGFAQRELDLLRKLPFVCPVGLGPRVLRADTAALAALAVFQALLGDWARRRG
ncbi:MAG TPA: 16S rRNA (uracil(1498)-N(3))-methyltransferase [Stellaceae bacterium]|nr:16S rRNA (uracil(1498)-N(3))-methyltransferase [Stellaceae bacterium]